MTSHSHEARAGDFGPGAQGGTQLRRLDSSPEMAWLSPPHVQSADASRNLGQIVVELVIPAGQLMNDRAGYRSRIEIEMRKWSRVVIAAVVEVDGRACRQSRGEV
jgi:hypothetical protein